MSDESPETPPQGQQARSIPSIIAIIAAVVSFFVSAGLGLALAILAVICGIIGVIMSMSPKIGGGIASTFGVIIGGAGVVTAIVKGVMHLF